MRCKNDAAHLQLGKKPPYGLGQLLYLLTQRITAARLQFHDPPALKTFECGNLLLVTYPRRLPSAHQQHRAPGCW